MSRRTKLLPIDAFRKAEGPETLKALGETRLKHCLSRISNRTPARLPASDIVSRIDDIAEPVGRGRAHFHRKPHN